MQRRILGIPVVLLIGPGILRERLTELAQFRTGYILMDGECGERWKHAN